MSCELTDMSSGQSTSGSGHQRHVAWLRSHYTPERTGRYWQGVASHVNPVNAVLTRHKPHRTPTYTQTTHIHRLY